MSPVRSVPACTADEQSRKMRVSHLSVWWIGPAADLAVAGTAGDNVARAQRAGLKTTEQQCSRIRLSSMVSAKPVGQAADLAVAGTTGDNVGRAKRAGLPKHCSSAAGHT